MNIGLDYYQLHPNDSTGKHKFSGEVSFNHMCGFRNRKFAKEVLVDGGSAFKPSPLLELSPYLDVHLYDDSLRAIMPTKEDFLRGNAMSHAHGIRAHRKMANRNLANIGTVVGYCGIANSEGNLGNMSDAMEFATSLAEAKRVQENEKKEKDVQKDLEKYITAAVRKLEKKNTI